MNSRLPRRPSITSWYCTASLVSTMPLGRRSKSTDDRSSSGSASAVDSVWARSKGDTAPEAITAPMKLILRSLADLARSSAALLLSLPACTSTLATPEREDCGGSTSVSKAASTEAYPDDHSMITDKTHTVTPRCGCFRAQIAAAGGRQRHKMLASAHCATTIGWAAMAAREEILVGVRGFEPPASTSRT